jgi:hypothetical protein
MGERRSSLPRRGTQAFWPREHGAYAQVVFPLATALWLGRASFSSIALSLAILAAFLAHEPLLIVLGARGAAVRREAGPRARRQGALLGSASAAAAGFALFYAESPVRWAAAALLPAVALAVALTLTRREKTIVGEMLVGLVLAFAAVPVALAAGLAIRAALQAAVAWSAVALVGTATVHALLARKKRGALAPSRALLAVCALLSAAAAVFALSGRGGWPLAAIPMTFVAAAALLLGVSPKRLKRLGWAMVLAHSAAAAALWASLRSPASGLASDGLAGARGELEATHADRESALVSVRAPRTSREAALRQARRFGSSRSALTWR